MWPALTQPSNLTSPNLAYPSLVSHLMFPHLIYFKVADWIY